MPDHRTTTAAPVPTSVVTPVRVRVTVTLPATFFAANTSAAVPSTAGAPVTVTSMPPPPVASDSERK